MSYDAKATLVPKAVKVLAALMVSNCHKRTYFKMQTAVIQEAARRARSSGKDKAAKDTAAE
jgi:hypothetical protein